MTHLILEQVNYLQKPLDFLIYLVGKAFRGIWTAMVLFGAAVIASRQASANKQIMDFIRIEYPNEAPEHVLWRIQQGAKMK